MRASASPDYFSARRCSFRFPPAGRVNPKNANPFQRVPVTATAIKFALVTPKRFAGGRAESWPHVGAFGAKRRAVGGLVVVFGVRRPVREYVRAFCAPGRSCRILLEWHLQNLQNLLPPDVGEITRKPKNLSRPFSLYRSSQICERRAGSALKVCPSGGDLGSAGRLVDHDFDSCLLSTKFSQFDRSGVFCFFHHKQLLFLVRS